MSDFNKVVTGRINAKIIGYRRETRMIFTLHHKPRDVFVVVTNYYGMVWWIFYLLICTIYNVSFNAALTLNVHVMLLSGGN